MTREYLIKLIKEAGLGSNYYYDSTLFEDRFQIDGYLEIGKLAKAIDEYYSKQIPRDGNEKENEFG